MSQFQQTAQLETAFRMFFESTNLGIFELDSLVASGSVKGNHTLLTIALTVPDSSIKSEDIAHHFIVFENQVKRLCFDFYARRGILVEPKPVLLAAGSKG